MTTVGAGEGDAAFLKGDSGIAAGGVVELRDPGSSSDAGVPGVFPATAVDAGEGDAAFLKGDSGIAAGGVVELRDPGSSSDAGVPGVFPATAVDADDVGGPLLDRVSVAGVLLFFCDRFFAIGTSLKHKKQLPAL